MNKKTKKVLSLALAAVLLVCTTVAATVAYLTANTGVVTNTFTVGNVAIDLDEIQVDPYGVPSDKGVADGKTVWTPNQNAPRIKENKYKLVPGHTYTKDPTVYVKGASEPCWVFVKVTVTDTVATVLDNFAVHTDWKPLTVDGAVVENIYYYKEIVDDATALAETEKVTLTPVFAQFKVLDNADVSNVSAADSIKVDAYAIQADGFTTAEAAWKANTATWEN